MFDIQPLTTREAVTLAHVQAETFKQAYANIHTAEDIDAYCSSAYSVETAVQELSSDNTKCYAGITSEGDVAGYYIANTTPCSIEQKVPSGELKRLYILETAYGSGLGAALFDHSVQTFKSLNINCVWLCVSNRNYKAQKFYQKRGFEFAGQGPLLHVGKDSLTSSILTLML
jgi:ribosomal protein S18 acetylase RimI-like enzyme